MIKKISIYGDGGSRGNPGPSASAFVCFVDGEIVHESSIYLGISTNNVAEYQSVITALTWFAKAYPDYEGEIIFYMDSELVTKQIKGEYRTKSSNLIPLVVKVQGLLKDLNTKVNFRSVPREKNTLADALVNRELDLQN